MTKDLKLGQICDDTSPMRDAGHIAVIRVKVLEKIAPGTKVTLYTKDDIPTVQATKAKRFVGVIDPFIHGDIPAGSYVLLYLKPGSVENLVHTWSTPDFPEVVHHKSFNSNYDSNDDYSYNDDYGCNGC